MGKRLTTKQVASRVGNVSESPVRGERLLTTKQVASRVGDVSESTVRYWRHTGYGPEGFRVGRRVLYPEAAVDKWLSDLRDAEQTA